MAQTWESLLFAHWRVPPALLRAQLPEGLELDTYGGDAYLAVTPFRITGLRMRGTLPLPYVSSFLELNVRTYVTAGGKPGIWFVSLDASSSLAVEAARLAYKLPYFRARMSCRSVGDEIEFASTRQSAPRPVVFSARYRPAGDVLAAAAGSLEHFLTERYCLYALDRRGALHRAEIHHSLWPLQAATAEIELNSMAPKGMALPGEDALHHFARRQDVVVWPLERVTA